MATGPKGHRDDPRCNGEGYYDPTAYVGIKNASKEQEEEERFKKLLYVIKDICKLSGFELAERVVLRDTQTGKVWR